MLTAKVPAVWSAQPPHDRRLGGHQIGQDITGLPGSEGRHIDALRLDGRGQIAVAGPALGAVVLELEGLLLGAQMLPLDDLHRGQRLQAAKVQITADGRLQAPVGEYFYKIFSLIVIKESRIFCFFFLLITMAL